MTNAYRWLVPVGVVAVVGGGVALTSAAASSTPDLPDITAEELVERALSSDVDTLVGTVRTEAELGLPELPEGLAAQVEGGFAAGDAASDDAVPGEDGPTAGVPPTFLGGTGSDPASVFLRLMSGESTIGIAQDGEERQRLTLVDDEAGLDLVRNGDTLWAYSAAEDTAVRVTLDDPPGGEHGSRGEHGAGGELPEATPGEFAEQLIAEADPTTELSVGTPQEVAGRDAYTLEITPRSDRTLLAGIEIAVDAETGLVLAVRVESTAQEEPAFQTGFVDLDLSAPDDSTFEFTPEESTTVVEGDEVGGWPWAHGEGRGPGRGPGDGGPSGRPWGPGEGRGPHGVDPEGSDGEAFDPEEFDPESLGGEGLGGLPGLGGLGEGLEGGDVTVVGEGWETVLVVAPPEGTELGTPGEAGDGEAPDGEPGPADPSLGGDAAAFAESLVTEVDGGQAVTTALLTVLFTDDGRVLLGPVPAEVLSEVAG